jgi:hypothetical protein
MARSLVARGREPVPAEAGASRSGATMTASCAVPFVIRIRRRISASSNELDACQVTPQCSPMALAQERKARFLIALMLKAPTESSPRGARIVGTSGIRPRRRKTTGAMLNGVLKKLFTYSASGLLSLMTRARFSGLASDGFK